MSMMTLIWIAGGLVALWAIARIVLAITSMLLHLVMAFAIVLMVVWGVSHFL